MSTGIVKPTILSYLWEVKNFNDACESTGEYIASPVFSTVYSFIKQDWQLRLFPKGDQESCKDYISIFLEYLGQENVNVDVTLSLLNESGFKVKEKKFTCLFRTQSSPYGFDMMAKHEFVWDPRNNVIAKDNTIRILCEIVYDSNLAAPIKRQHIDLPDDHRLQEFDEFEKLLEAENTADVTLEIGTDKIKAHKAIIMNRSPVFQAMFEHNMIEKESNVVKITDIKYEVMKEVIRFLYVAKVNQIEKIASDLFIAAEKYSIEGLKVLCEKQLFNDLKVENAVEYLKLADMCHAVDLKCKIIKFIVSNLKDVVHNPELKSLPVEVVCEVLSAVASNNSNK